MSDMPQGVLSGILDELETVSPEVIQNIESSDAEDIIEMEDFDFEGFQVVRREFFAHTKEPSLTFNDCKIYVNAACLNRMRDVEFVQVLVNKETKKLAIRPCAESDKDSFQWCNNGKDATKKTKPKQVSCKIFFAKMCALMDWKLENRYKLLGKIIHANGEYLILFDLTTTEIYRRISADGEKIKRTRTPIFSNDETLQFGLPVQIHHKQTQINIFDGFAVYEIKESGDNQERVIDAIADSSADTQQAEVK